MKQKTFYFWGAPISKRTRRALLAEMRQVPLDSRFNELTIYLNRITDKTGGVLAIAGLVLAISNFVLDKAGEQLKVPSHSLETEIAFLICIAGVSFSTLGILVLCTNLFTRWRPNWELTEADMDRSFMLFCQRAITLQVSLYGVMAAAVLSCVALGLLEAPYVKQTVAGQTIVHLLSVAGPQITALMQR